MSSSFKKLPKLRDFPEWVAAQQRLNSLLAEFQKIRHEDIPAIETQLGRIQESAGTSKLDARALALIEGKELASDEGSVSSLRDKLLTLRERAEILGRAVELQNRAITTLAGELSVRLRPEIVPEYTKLVGRIDAALRELVEACAAEQDFVSDLEQGEIRFGCVAKSCGFSAMGDLRDSNSIIAVWRRENSSYLLAK